MRKTKDGRRLFSREFKLSAIRRVQKGEQQAAVARELKIPVRLLAGWRSKVRKGGEAALGEIGRGRWINRSGTTSPKETQIAELERLIGRQQAEIDFLEQALRQVEELRRTKKGNGGTASSKS
jgi:transposase-like protein